MIAQLKQPETLLPALAYEGASDGAHGLMPQSSNPDYLKHWQEEFVRPRRRPDMFNRIIRTPAIALTRTLYLSPARREMPAQSGSTSID